MSDSGSASGSRPGQSDSGSASRPGGSGGEDELVGRFAGAISRWAQSEMDALVGSAFEEVRQEIGAALRSAIRRELVAALLVRLEGSDAGHREEGVAHPRPPSGRGTHGNGNGAGGKAEEASGSSKRAAPFEEGCYLYAITRADINIPGGVRGVDGGRLRAVDAGALRAVISSVDTAGFDEQAFADRVGDPEWVERKVRAHDDVLRRLVFAGPLIPLRFGTVVASEQDVRGLLERHSTEFEAELDRLQGTAEWGVKGYWLDDALRAHITRQQEERDIEIAGDREDGTIESRAGSRGGGTSYLLDKQRDREVAAEMQRVREQVLDACHQGLSEESRDAVLLPVTADRSSGEGEALVLNATYLVSLDRLPAFQATVRELATEHAEAGLILETTGPWPPYSFVAGDVLEREGA